MFAKVDNTDLVIAKWLPISKKVYWVVVSIIDDKQLAEDAIQEALIIAIDKYATLKDPLKFEPWFLKIAIRIAYSMISINKEDVSVDTIETLSNISEDSKDYVEDTLLEPEYRELVFSIISSLEPPNRKYLFYLRYLEDKSLNEICSITGIREGTLKSIFFRMRQELSTLLAKEFGIYEK